MARTKTKVAVYIGRMQLHHLGHDYVLQHCVKNYDVTVVLVGSAFKARDIKNPFTYQERASILDVWFKDLRAAHFILPLKDQTYNNPKWIQSVQEAVNTATQQLGLSMNQVDVTIVGSDRDNSTWYLKAFPQWNRDLIDQNPNFLGLAATQLRERLWMGVDHSDWSEISDLTKSFLSLWKGSDSYADLVEDYDWLRRYWAQWKGPHAPVFKTVDATVIQSGHVLTITRAMRPGKGQVAVPGGFVKPHQTLLDAVIEELIDETGIRLAEGKRWREITEQTLIGSIVAQREFDAPDRDMRGRMFTTNFLFQLDDTKPLPEVSGQLVPVGDEHAGQQETVSADWRPISSARAQSEMWYGDHHGMFDTMLGLVGSNR